jgi:hypothetical protein
MDRTLIATAYFPPIRYMAACAHSAEIITEVHETYQRQTARNHCQVSGPNGILLLTVPVKRINGNHTQTKDIRVSKDLPWQKMHWRAICSSYNKSPFFLYYQDLIETIFDKEYKFLVDLNQDILLMLFEILRIDALFTLSCSFEKSPAGVTDLRQTLVSKHQELFPIPRYIQSFESRTGFISNLSILDLLFHLGPETSAYLSKNIQC